MAVLTVTNALDTKQGAQGSLRAALKTAKSGDTIRFSAQLKNKTITLARNLPITKDIIIDGSKAPGLTLSGSKKMVIFAVEGKGRAFTVRGLTLANASHSFNGGAIRVMQPNAKIRVENSEFKNNTAGFGSAIWAKTNADVTVLNSRFYGNRSTVADDTSAGAISVFDKSKLTVKGSTFIGNKGISGGAIGTIFTQLLVEDSVFKDNTSVRWSGAVHADGASIPWDKRYYKGNKPRDRKGRSIIIRNSQFDNNRSGGRGGAVGIWGYDQDLVTIAKNTFTGNQVTKYKGFARGGALHASGKQVNIDNNRFTNNRSADEGGALWHQGQSPTTITNTTFTGNQAAKGGAIYNHQWLGPGTTIKNSTFKGNRAPKGSVLYKNKPRPVVIANSQFSNNGANEIGGDLTNFKRSGSSQKASLMAADEILTPPVIDTEGSPSPDNQNPPQIGAPTQNQAPGFRPTAPTELPGQTADTLVTWLQFNESALKTSENSAPGLNKPAVLHNQPTWEAGVGTTQNGAESSAIALNGQTQSVTLPNSQDLNLGIHQQRTVSFWFKADDTSPGNKKQVLYEEGAGTRGLNAYLYDDLLYVGGWNTPNQESGWKGTWLNTSDIAANQWHHVALVLDGSDRLKANALTAFVDGNKIGSGSGSQLWQHSGDIRLGNTSGSTRFHDGLTAGNNRHGFAGALDEVAIFNDALSAQAVQGLAAS